jgi:hypothetical protein
MTQRQARHVQQLARVHPLFEPRESIPATVLDHTRRARSYVHVAFREFAQVLPGRADKCDRREEVIHYGADADLDPEAG